MIDIDAPTAPYVFAVARLLRDFCNMLMTMTTDDTPSGRQFTRKMMQPTIEALRWIAVHKFQGQKARLAVDELETSCNRLAELHAERVELSAIASDLTNCPACGQPLIRLGEIFGGHINEFGQYVNPYPSRSHCDKCYNLVEPALKLVSDAFGTECI